MLTKFKILWLYKKLKIAEITYNFIIYRIGE